MFVLLFVPFWRFSYREFVLEKIESSRRKPIFALFFNGTHEMRANMSQLESRYDSVEFTEIDCLL